MIKPAIILITGIALLTGCSSAPSGRSQLLLYSNSQMSSLGSQSFEQLKKDQQIEHDPAINRYVQCVAKAVTQNVPKDGFDEWEIVVFKDKQVNAFALPGGKIGVYTGLLDVAKNQDQLATVIGHEVAHVLAEHGNERMSQSQLASAGLAVGAIAIGSSKYSQYQQVAVAALGVGVQYGVLLPYSRLQESEADNIGLKLMANAGFNPQESVSLWRNMSAASGGKSVPELLSTHPSNQNRINALQQEANSLNTSDLAAPQCTKS